MAVAAPVTGRHSIVAPVHTVRPGRAVLDGLRRRARRRAAGARGRGAAAARRPDARHQHGVRLVPGGGPRARAALVEGPGLLGSRPAGRRRDLVRGHGLLLLAVGDARRPLAAADRGRVGARRPRRARRGAARPGATRSRAARFPRRRSPGPGAVGRGTANDYGLLDIGTVVHEWCHDWYAPDAYRAMRRYDPRGPERATTRVSRGGSWRQHVRDVPPARARAARRTRAPPTAASVWCARCRERRARRRTGRGRAPAGAAPRAEPSSPSRCSWSARGSSTSGRAA